MMAPILKPKPRVVVQRERRAAQRQTAQTVRRAVWRRDGGRCRVCHGRQRLQVHHVVARSLGGKWTTANCVLFCQSCHQEAHAQILIVQGRDADQPDGLTFERQQWW